jgi:hypothetical protein
MEAPSIPDQPPYRPPSEACSVLVRVTRGCAWNRCGFCGMYKGLRFEARPIEEIATDVRALRVHWPVADAVFLADSDALAHPKIVDIVALVRATFPEAERITSYTRLRTLRQRSDERLHALRAAGLTRLHVGLESGAEAVLARVQKGIQPGDAIDAGRRAVAAGFDLCLYVLCGLGGESHWEMHAAETGHVLAAIAPHFVRLRSLVLLPGTPLFNEWQAGAFVPASPVTRLRETQRLIERFVEELLARAAATGVTDARSAERETEIASDHFSNYVWADGELIYGGVNGFLPADAPLLLATLAAALAAASGARQVHDPAALARTRGADIFASL